MASGRQWDRQSKGTDRQRDSLQGRGTDRGTQRKSRPKDSATKRRTDRHTKQTDIAEFKFEVFWRVFVQLLRAFGPRCGRGGRRRRRQRVVGFCQRRQRDAEDADRDANGDSDRAPRRRRRCVKKADWGQAKDLGGESFGIPVGSPTRQVRVNHTLRLPSGNV